MISSRLERIAAWLLGPASLLSLLLLTVLPVLGGVWLLTSPAMFVRTEALDLAGLLEGGWRVYQGLVPHIDFHEPVGQLNFWLIAAGLRWAGHAPQAFLAGEMVVLAAIFMAAVWAAVRRLPLMAAVVFVLFTCLLVLLPANVGARLGDYSFAMSYNRYGWSAICVLAVLLFVPPRQPSRWCSWDAAVGAALVAAMFYSKITYFLAGEAAIVLALVVCDHVRRARVPWFATAAILMLNALLPHHYPYLADLWRFARYDTTNLNPHTHLVLMFDNNAELALGASGLLVAILLWRRGLMPRYVPAASIFMLMASWLLIAHNTQVRGLPLAASFGFVLGAMVAKHDAGGRHLERAALLAAALTWPALTAGNYATQLIFYHRAATASHPDDYTVTQTNLRGLRLSHAAISNFGPRTLAAAELFTDGNLPPGRIVALLPVNALPFLLKWPSPKGGDLFLTHTLPTLPAEEVLQDADYVVVPKRAESDGIALRVVQQYQAYLAEHFVLLKENQGWRVLGRRGAHASNPGISTPAPRFR
jgi:hypothetical protein